jgi:hypothetical protein
MYALVEDQMVLLGPIQFNYRMINSVLEDDLELDYRVSSASEASVPIEINDTVRIIPARNEYHPSYNPRYHEHTGPEVQIYEKEVVFLHGIREKSLDQAKAERKVEIAPYRKEKENVDITLTVNEVEIKVSTSRENRLALASKAMSGEGPYNFKFTNDTWVEITKTDIEYILQQIDIEVQKAFDWELEKNQEIDACQTIDEVYEVMIRPSANPIGDRLNDLNV